MRICLTANVAWNIWNFRRPLVRMLLAEGHEVQILAPPDETVESLIALGCAFTPLQMDRAGLNPLAELELLRRFDRHFRKTKPDVILSFTVKNNLFGALAAARQGIPILPNVTGLGTAFLSGGVLRRIATSMYRIAFRKCRTVFFQNEDDRDLFVGAQIVRKDQAKILPGSGIDLDEFKPRPLPQTRSKTVFLMVARLLRDKGVVEFAQAAKIVREKRPEAVFRLMGEAGYVNRTAISQELVDSWVEEGYIEYLGKHADVRDEIARADCVVLPSYREGAPRTLIEAAAMARPTVTTDVPGCRAVVAHRTTGFLCAVRDPVSLAQSMLEFLDLDPHQRTRMGAAARAKMEREYSVERVVAAYRRELDSLG